MTTSTLRASAILCVDFGTAHSKASLCLDPLRATPANIRPLQLGAASGAGNAYLTPSAIFVDEGRLYFGPKALELAQAQTGAKRDPALSFKMLFSDEGDPTEALSYRVRPSVDPTQTFKHRDILVLYIAYLEQIARAALANEMGGNFDLAAVERRYTVPVWRLHEKAAPLFRMLFTEAKSIVDRIGPLLTAPEGLSIAHCRGELERAASSPSTETPWTGIFESHAALAAQWAFGELKAPIAGILDVGAGTADFAAFEIETNGAQFALKEIVEARICANLAGDEIDRVMLDCFVEKMGKKADRSAQSLLWRQTRLIARELKTDLFARGKTQVKFGGRALSLSRAEFEKSAMFKHYKVVMGAACRRSLTPLLQRATMLGVPEVKMLLAGGGAHFPFLPQILIDAAKKVAPKMTLTVIKVAPTPEISARWPHDLHDAFSQMATSMGGALLDVGKTT